ncbi:MAG: MJ1255/VC2487 family glycosyltransferase [Candidatus Marinimicrobia bacterium]|nr:MJ1255/VC2487 family glycosyltransferase [Candidatus Neomarinimicrobiota bacterium]
MTDNLNILYGVQATGNGHITRSREVVSALKQRGHRVNVIVSGRPGDQLWGMESFMPFTLMEGLTFHTRAGKVQKLSTILNAKPFKMYRDINHFNARDIDVVISDFEPITSRIARKHGIPSIGIGHQYAFNYDVPMTNSNPVARALIQKFAPVDLSIGLHWHHYNEPILPPIIPSVWDWQKAKDRSILIYLPFEDHSLLIAKLKKLPDLDFIVYSNQMPLGPGPEANITVKPLSRETFPRDLKTVEGVICNAGFELPSETISLGKKLLVKPLQGQPEQESNAYALQELNYGSTCSEVTPEVIMNWYSRAKQKQVVFPNIVSELVDWLEDGQWDRASLGLLSERLWAGIIPEEGKRSVFRSKPGDMNQHEKNVQMGLTY